MAPSPRVVHRYGNSKTRGGEARGAIILGGRFLLRKAAFLACVVFHGGSPFPGLVMVAHAAPVVKSAPSGALEAGSGRAIVDEGLSSRTPQQLVREGGGADGNFSGGSALM